LIEMKAVTTWPANVGVTSAMCVESTTQATPRVVAAIVDHAAAHDKFVVIL
jgi:hypothetical protein